MQLKQIKNFLCWEVFLFVLVHFAILFYVFLILDAWLAGYIIETWMIPFDTNPDSKGLVLAILLLPGILMPIFVILKYLSLPIVLWIIQKWSKKEEIKNWIITIIQSYKLQAMVLFIALIIDFAPIPINYFINFIIFDIYGNPSFYPYMDWYIQTYRFLYFIFGGLTGSYLAIFLFLFIRKKFGKILDQKNFLTIKNLLF